MNDTLQDGNRPSGNDSESNFTRLALIGMFIALQLCQLTQPYGSLLFRGGGGFLWRCNPLSSFTEACIIFFSLGRSLFRSWNRQGGEIVRNLQKTAGALLLLRAAAAKDDAASLLDKLTTEAPAHEAPRAHFPHGPGLGTESADIELSTMAARAGLVRLSRQSTLESGRRSADTRGLTSNTAETLYAAFGDDVLARKGFRVGLLAAFAELCVIVKMFSVRKNDWFSAFGFLSALGWIAVQSLLLLLHARKMEEDEMMDTIRLAAGLQKQLPQQDRWWSSLFLALHLPPFAYVSYLISFPPWISQDAAGFLGFLKGSGHALDVFSAGVVASLSIITAVCLVSLFLYNLLVYQLRGRLRTNIVFLGCSFVLAWLGMAAKSHFQQICGKYVDTKDQLCPGHGFAGSWKDNVVMHFLVDQIYEFTWNSIWLLFFLTALMTAYLLLAVPKALQWGIVGLVLQTGGPVQEAWPSYTERHHRDRRASLCNAVLVLIVFIIYVIRYDELQSSKPEWVEVLG